MGAGHPVNTQERTLLFLQAWSGALFPPSQPLLFPCLLILLIRIPQGAFKTPKARPCPGQAPGAVGEGDWVLVCLEHPLASLGATAGPAAHGA